MWNAFQFLTDTRNYGMGGPLKINPTDMWSLLDMKGVNDQDDIDLFLTVIPLLDSIWTEDHYREQEVKRKRDKNKR